MKVEEKPKCPRCGKEVYYLVVYSKSWDFYLFDGEEYDHRESIPIRKDEFHCPQCAEVLFTDEGDAKEFFSKKVSAHKAYEIELPR